MSTGNLRTVDLAKDGEEEEGGTNGPDSPWYKILQIFCHPSQVLSCCLFEPLPVRSVPECQCMCISCSAMDANLSQLVQRLEAVTDRLENISGQSSASTTSSQPAMDSG